MILIVVLCSSASILIFTAYRFIKLKDYIEAQEKEISKALAGNPDKIDPNRPLEDLENLAYMPKFEVERESLKNRIRYLGSGCFGKVELHKINEELVAVKMANMANKEVSQEFEKI